MICFERVFERFAGWEKGRRDPFKVATVFRGFRRRIFVSLELWSNESGVHNVEGVAD